MVLIGVDHYPQHELRLQMTRNEIYKYALIGGGFFSAVLILILLQPDTPDMETALPSVPQDRKSVV